MQTSLIQVGRADVPGRVGAGSVPPVQAAAIGAEVAREPEFAEAFPAGPPPDPVLSVLRPEQYASVLDRLGYAEQHVRLQVYGHRLASSAEVVEWVRGTSLVRFREQLAAPV